MKPAAKAIPEFEQDIRDYLTKSDPNLHVGIRLLRNASRDDWLVWACGTRRGYGFAVWHPTSPHRRPTFIRDADAPTPWDAICEAEEQWEAEETERFDDFASQWD